MIYQSISRVQGRTCLVLGERKVVRRGSGGDSCGIGMRRY